MTHSPQLAIHSPRSRYLIPALIIAYMTAMALTSHGFLEADEITHFLIAREVWQHWTSIVGIWGRLGATALYAPLAPLGPNATQLIAVLVTALTAWGTAKLAKLCMPPGAHGFFRRHSTMFAWLLLFAQPCVLLYSFTIMTEMPLACTWVWAMVALCRRRVYVAGLLIGIGGLMRPEGWIAIAAWPVWLLLVHYCYQRMDQSPPADATAAVPAARPLSFPALLLSAFLAGLPVLGWYLLGVYAKHITVPSASAWMWCIDDFPWAAKSQYGRTGSQFLAATAASMAFWMWVPFGFGCWAAWRQRRVMPLTLVVLVAPAIGLYLLHGTLGSFGLFGSMSAPRYFICVAPMLAVVSLLGFIECQRHWRLWLPGVAIVGSCVPVVVFTLSGSLPQRPVVEQERLDVVVQAIKDRGIRPQDIIASHPYVMLALGKAGDSIVGGRLYHPEQIASAPPGTVIVMDEMLWVTEGHPPTEMLQSWGYREDPQVAADVEKVRDRYEPLSFKPPQPSKVRLWVKMDVPAASAPMTQP